MEFQITVVHDDYRVVETAKLPADKDSEIRFKVVEAMEGGKKIKLVGYKLVPILVK